MSDGDAGCNRSVMSSDRPTVAVVIPVFNQARFLADALSSVQRQTRQVDEIIVVDDGSTTDDPAAVVAQFENVKLIRQPNHGLAAARNTGLRSCTTSHVVFLDADDLLLPNALEVGLACAASHPDCAFVYGGYRLISEDGQRVSPDIVRPITGHAYHTFLRQYLIGAIMAVLYRRDCLLAVNGFSETLRRCEDYELNIRIAHKYPIASHMAVVAEYRQHGQAMSNNLAEMLRTTLNVLDSQRGLVATDLAGRKALRAGRAFYREHYVSRMIDAAFKQWNEHHNPAILARDLMEAARLSSRTVIRRLLGAVGRRVAKVAPRPIVRPMESIRGLPSPTAIGSVSFGDLKRHSPISDNYGWDRGTPVDRYYIEKFLAENAVDVRGRVLELDDNAYTRRFGGDRVEQSEILSEESTNPRATIVGNLVRAETLPEASFDCIILTQVLQFIFELESVVDTLHRALKAGGVLLVTVPGISRMKERWPWYWTFTTAAVEQLLQRKFGPDAVAVEEHGNVFAATAFLYGLALEELDVSDLAVDDARYPVTVAARAVKR